MTADDGAPDARLAAALAADDGTPARRGEVWAALVDARVFLALSARALGHEVSRATGLVQESQADMALLSIAATSGARALPAFTDGHAVQRWRAEARPVRVSGPQACATVLEDGADALLLDPTGVALAVTGADLVELAAGRVPVPGAALSSRRGALPDAALEDPELVAALALALAGERTVRAARLLSGDAGPVLGLVLAGSLGPAELAGLADRIRTTLGPSLPGEGLDLAVVPADGPGTPVPVRRRRFGLRR